MLADFKFAMFLRSEIKRASLLEKMSWSTIYSKLTVFSEFTVFCRIQMAGHVYIGILHQRNSITAPVVCCNHIKNIIITSSRIQSTNYLILTFITWHNGRCSENSVPRSRYTDSSLKTAFFQVLSSMPPCRGHCCWVLLPPYVLSLSYYIVSSKWEHKIPSFILKARYNSMT